MTHTCKCGKTRWKTLEKKKRYQCRSCGYVVKDELKALIIEQYKDRGDIQYSEVIGAE